MEPKIRPLAMTSTGDVKASGLSIWRWSAGTANWSMLEDRSEEGFHPGAGPTQAGVFDGQIVRWVSVAATLES
jgi:hypothetical protein